MVKGTLQIHSENILPIIKKWLYSDKEIFVRELVSNANDAIQKVKILSDQGLATLGSDEFRIDIKIDKEKKTLVFSDNGIGMDAEEVVKYIAQIAFSGAEEFVSKYQTNNEKDQFIGHFGLGFYSAYMVAQKVEVDTLSYKSDAEPVLWTCDGTSDYLLEKGTRATRGTDITLYIDKENEEFLEQTKLESIFTQYCSFFPYPIYLNGKHINHKEPLWIKPASECTTEEYLEFYRHLYPSEPDPLLWVHLNVDYPFHLKGILYFPKIMRDFDLKKNSVQLYCNRVFVSDNCKDLIPHYLAVLRGVIDSPDIPLNVSRSYLQMDRTVRQLANHISKKVSDSLANLYKTDKERFTKIWEDISPIIKLGILEDEKFYERSKEFLIWKLLNGNWETAEEYIERNKEKTKDKLYYTRDEHTNHFTEMYGKQGIDIILSQNPIDQYVFQFLERKITPAIHFQRIDAGLEDHFLDTSREKTILDAEGKTEAVKIAEFIQKELSEENLEVEAKSLAADGLPGYLLMDENQRRMRDYFMSMDASKSMPLGQLMGKRKFIVNTNNPIIEGIHKVKDSSPELAKEMVKEVYELSLLSQKEMEPATFQKFITRTNKVLEMLVKLAVS